jgi:hypothetical protein
MNKLLKKSLLAATLAVTMAGSANAGYISLDWQEEGDELAFLDEDAGLEWLMLTETAGMSLNEVVTELDEGGMFEGWRLASRSEVTDLFIDVIDYDSFNEGTTTATWSGARGNIYGEFTSLFGWAYTNSSAKYSYGLYLNDMETSTLTDEVLMGGVKYDGNTYLYEDYTSTSYSMDWSSGTTGVYLVGDGGATLTTQEDMSLVSNNPLYATATEVSEPSGVLLMSASLLTVGFLRRKKRQSCAGM